MSAPRITVLMTLHNKGPYVADAVRSVLASSHGGFELLVIDDASTDEGPAIVRSFADPRIRMLRNEANRGRAASANRGFDEARGEYIAILDADDAMAPDRLAKQAALLDARPEVGACGSCARLIGERHRVACWPATDEEARGLLLFEDPLLYGSAMLRRSVLREHGLRCPEEWTGPGMDYLFLLRLVRHTRIANIPEPLTLYRIGPNNLRHGRDPAEFSAPIVRAALEHFGIAASEERVRAHLLLLRRAPLPRAGRQAREARRWAEELLALNQAGGWFTPSVLRARLGTELDHLFCRMADERPAAALPLLLRAGSAPWRRLRYLLARLARGPDKGQSPTLPSP